MGFIKDLVQRVRDQRKIKRNQKKTGLDCKQLENDIKEWQNRDLDMEEILSREYSADVIIDAYEYCMRKCEWNPESINSTSVKDFLLCVLFMGEVDNGGIAQFLFNNSGDLTSETIEALKRIDEEYAGALISASQFFPDGIVPKDCEKRNEIMDSFDDEINERFEELDEKVFERDITQGLFDYIHAHETDFLNV